MTEMILRDFNINNKRIYNRFTIEIRKFNLTNVNCLLYSRRIIIKMILSNTKTGTVTENIHLVGEASFFNPPA